MENLRKESRDKFLEVWYRQRPYLTAAHLKYIAIILMLLSHIAQTNFLYGFGDQYYELADFFVFVGRIAMPLFCFFTVQAVIFTKDIKKYFTRMFIFALISEIPFDLALFGVPFMPFGQNVIFTLLIGAITIYGIDYLWKSENKDWLKIAGGVLIGIFGMLAATLLMTDYDFKGVLAIILIYLARNSKIATTCSLLAGFLFEFEVYGRALPPSYGFVYLAIPLLMLYNGQRGKQNKWLFYVFYPAHLLVLYLLKLLLI